MSTENADVAGAGAKAPAVTNDPKGDAEAYAASKATQGAAVTPDPQPDDETAKAAAAEVEAKAEKERQQKSRTTQYFDKVKADNAEMRRRLNDADELQKRLDEIRGNYGQQQKQPNPQQRQGTQQHAGRPPTLEECDFDTVAWQQAHTDWTLAELTRRQTAAENARKEYQTQETYNQRVTEFINEHPDFEEVVGSIEARFFSPELERAVLAHEKGPEIAYHLGTNEDALWHIASIRPELVADAVNRLASRLGSAPVEQVTPDVPNVPATVQKPISKAPPPAPVLGGRSTASIDPGKMTDDDWYKADREKRRKR